MPALRLAFLKEALFAAGTQAPPLSFKDTFMLKLHKRRSEKRSLSLNLFFFFSEGSRGFPVDFSTQHNCILWINLLITITRRTIEMLSGLTCQSSLVCRGAILYNSSPNTCFRKLPVYCHPPSASRPASHLHPFSLLKSCQHKPLKLFFQCFYWPLLPCGRPQGEWAINVLSQLIEKEQPVAHKVTFYYIISPRTFL